MAAAKIKVIELAKELGVTSKDLMVAAEEMGHKGVRAMTPLDQKLANELRVKLGKGREFASMKMRVKVKQVEGGKPVADRNGRGYEEMAGFADGIRADIDGNIWVGAGWVGDGYDGVHVFAPDGERIGLILLPEICSNVCFGGTKRNRLFMTGSQSLYAVYLETQGAHIT